MGYYIETPDHLNKAKQLIDFQGAKPIHVVPESLSELPADQALICVVQNGPFDAAALCYDDRELAAFKLPDSHMPNRPRDWLTMDKELAHKLAGYKE